jgi:ABC-type bacteriocin/lantibiotic exporter with double-glycine peptidase domain
VWLDVPFVKQPRDGCGAASIAMVIEYWQQQQASQTARPRVEEIQRALYSRREHGIHATDLERYLQEHGFLTFAVAAEWSDLQHHLEMGRPLIAALRLGGKDLHYVVVTGLDGEVVLKNDPAVRKLVKQSRADFEREWSGTGNWMLLAVPSSSR